MAIWTIKGLIELDSKYPEFLEKLALSHILSHVSQIYAIYTDFPWLRTYSEIR